MHVFKQTLIHRTKMITPQGLSGTETKRKPSLFLSLLPSPVLFAEGTGKNSGHNIDLFSPAFFLFLVLILKKTIYEKSV